MLWKCKGDVTRDDSQQQFLAQHSVATLLRYCFEWLQYCFNIAKGSCSSCSEEKSPMVPNPDPKQY